MKTRLSKSETERKDKLIKMHLPTLCSSSSASTLTIWFSPDHKWNVSDRVVKEIGTLLSLTRTLYASDYDSDSDSDSVNSENLPLWFAVLKRIAVCVPFISRSKLSAVWTAQAICLKNLSAIQTAWAICAKTLLSFPKSGVICICFFIHSNGWSYLFQKNTWFLSQKNFVASHLHCQSVF